MYKPFERAYSFVRDFFQANKIAVELVTDFCGERELKVLEGQHKLLEEMLDQVEDNEPERA